MILFWCVPFQRAGAILKVTRLEHFRKMPCGDHEVWYDSWVATESFHLRVHELGHQQFSGHWNESIYVYLGCSLLRFKPGTGFAWWFNLIYSQVETPLKLLKCCPCCNWMCGVWLLYSLLINICGRLLGERRRFSTSDWNSLLDGQRGNHQQPQNWGAQYGGIWSYVFGSKESSTDIFCSVGSQR